MISLPDRLFLDVGFFPFQHLDILCHFLLACKYSAEKSADSLMGVPLFITSCFSLAAFKDLSWDFPGCPVVKNLPSNVGDASSIPGQGSKIPHATGQLSPSALEPMHHNERSCMLQLRLVQPNK